MGTTKKPTLTKRTAVRTGRTTEIMYTGDGSAYLRFNQYKDQLCCELEAYRVWELTEDLDVMKLAAKWHLRGEAP